MNERTCLCKCHPDFHIPPEVVVGDEFDGMEYARKARQAGVESLVTFAKCHYGYSYYYTDAGTRHPGLTRDMLSEFTRGCRAEGLRTTFYYSVFLDAAAGRKHHDWVFRPAGKTLEEMLNEKYVPICVNSGYLEELLIPQVLELVGRYDVDELFFDTMSDFHPCYCDACRRKFGKPIPTQETDPDWLAYVQWYHQNFNDFFKHIFDAVHSARPGVSIAVNWKWSAMLPETPPEHVKYLVGDLFTSGDVSAYYSRYWAGTGLPFDYMCGRFLHGLGDWSNNTPETLKYTAASAIANGGGFYLIDRQLPCGRMEERAYALMNDVFSFVGERRDFVEHTRHVPETAVLHSLEHLVGPDMRYFPQYDVRVERARQFRGASRFLMHHALHYTAVNQDTLKRTLSDYRLLILPEQDYLDREATDAMAAFAQSGGSILIVQNCEKTEINAELLALAGVRHVRQSDAPYAYIANDACGMPDPVLVRGRPMEIKAESGTRVLARFLEPSAGTGKEFGHGFAPPSGVAGTPAITARTVGKGLVIYAAAPLFTSYETHVNPPIAALLKRLYDMLLPEPLVSVQCRAQVETAAVRQGDDLIIHLVNHSGKEAYAGGGFHWPVTEYIPELRNIPIWIRAPRRACAVTTVPAGIAERRADESGYVKLSVSSLNIMASIRLEGYFLQD